MTHNVPQALTDFEFRSDFATSQAPSSDLHNPNQLDTVSVTASELAELLAAARADGLQAALTQQAASDAARNEVLANQLKAALGELLRLAECLERLSLAPDDASKVRTHISDVCTHIVAGQGDLFADQ